MTLATLHLSKINPIVVTYTKDELRFVKAGTSLIISHSYTDNVYRVRMEAPYKYKKQRQYNGTFEQHYLYSFDNPNKAFEKTFDDLITFFPTQGKNTEQRLYENVRKYYGDKIAFFFHLAQGV